LEFVVRIVFRRSAQMAIVGRYVFIGSALLGGSALAQNFTFTTWAGTVGSAGSADGTGSAARFNLPVGLAIDAAKNVYVVDSGNNTIRKITSVGVVTTLAGFAGGVGSTDGIGSAARFNGPSAMTVDGAGNLYVADCGNHTVRKITGGGVVTTLAGFPGASGSTDGTGSAARFNTPQGVAVDSAGNVYVAESYNHTIRKITSGGVVTTLAGTAGIASASLRKRHTESTSPPRV